MNQSLQLRVLFLCLFFSSADNWKHTRHDFQVGGGATIASKLIFQSSIKRLGIFKYRLCCKSYFRCLCCKVLTIFGGSSLHDDRVTLQWTRYVEGATHLEMFTSVDKHMHLLEINVDTCILIVD